MKRFMVALTVSAMGILGLMTALVLPAGSANAVGPSMVRFQGVDRFATSAAIAQASYSPGVPVAYIATGLDFPDALAGGAAAAKAGGPLLLVRPDLIPTQIAAELTRLTPASIVVLGGKGAANDTVLASLRTYTTGSVTRVSGADRYGTAANLAASFPTGSPVFIATGKDFPDALAGTAAAAAKHAAILLTTPTAIPSGTATALRALAPSSITILGGTGAVSAAVATQLGAFAPTVTRLSGSDRYATAASIARSAFPSATGVFLTTGVAFADALTGGPVAGLAGQPLMLVTGTCLPSPTAALLAADGPTTVTLLGGTGVLGAGVESLTSCSAFTDPPTVTPPVVAAPGPVSNVTATPASTSVLLSWTNPPEASLIGVMIRRAPGATAPASATTGTLVTDAAKSATSFTDSGLMAGTQYSYALFAHDSTPAYSASATVVVTSTTTIIVVPPPSVVFHTAYSSVRVRAGASTQTTQISTIVDAGTSISIACQIGGESVTAVGGTSAVWDKLNGYGNGYISDLFVQETLYAQFDSRIARCVTPPPSSTMLDQFVANTTGQSLFNVNGTYQGECVSLVSQYLNQVYGVRTGAWGNAVDYRAGGTGGAHMAANGFSWSSDQNFQDGDVLVWGAGAWTTAYGHIAVWYHGKIYDQNFAGRRTAGLDAFFSYGFLGHWRKG